MAKKRQRRKPQVPRPRVGRSRPDVAETVGDVKVEPETKEVPASLMGPRNISMKEFHEYVRGDLTRIAIFGSTILAGMLALKFVVGL
ncbi:MAG: hypothetical protein M3220_08100 [Chloroflexota bacterium]|nr:hypothetical protein [Chloroflexota bacterium]